MNAQPTIGVIVVSYNTAALLGACLDSLAACMLPLRIVVVDNASADGSAALVRERYPHVELIALEANAGYAGGTNTGLEALQLERAAAADYVLVLNPDTEVVPGAIETLADFLAHHPRVGMVGPRLLNRDGSLQTAAFRFPTLLMSLFDLFPPGEVLPGRFYGSWWHGRYPQETGAAPFAIDHPLGACMLLRSAVVCEVGGMDASYFMYSEEVDWCWRIKQAGWAIWQVPAAEVFHVGGASTSQFRWNMFVALYRSRARFVARYYSPGRRRAYQWIVRLGIVRLILASWLEYRRGRLDHTALRAQLLAYGQVLQINAAG